MSIAITGATGSIGRALVRAISGRELVLLGRSRRRMEDLFGDRRPACTYRETDYTQTSLKAALGGVEAVVHLAAHRPGAGPESFRNFAVNIAATEALWQACREAGISHAVYASTGSVYGPAFNRVPYAEDQALRPPSFYAESKLVGEHLGHLYGLRIKSLRFAPVIGRHEKERFMRMAFIRNALEGKPLVVFGDGGQRWEYLYVEDAASAVLAALARPDLSGAFNIGMGSAVSNLEYARMVNRIFADDALSIRHDQSRPSVEGVFLMSGERAKNLLAFTPRHPLEAALKDMRTRMQAASLVETP